MDRAIYNGAMGMLVQQKLMDVIGNNLANVDSNGYRKDDVVFKSYLKQDVYNIGGKPFVQIDDRVKAKKIGQLGSGVTLDGIYHSDQEGNLESTHISTDMALIGKGFFTVYNPSKKQYYYTRDGHFIMNKNNILVDSNGNELVDITGKNIKFKDGYSIDENGFLRDKNNKIINKIMIVNFKDPTQLRKVGYTYYLATKQSGSANYDKSTAIKSGYLEKSNVNAVEEMVKMITAQRIYNFNSKTITTIDEMLDKLVNQVARI
jgi:flagellar basal-body rod protein FlgF